MKNMRTEYKLLLYLAIIFFTILIIAMLKYNVFTDKIDELKEKQYVNCTEEILTKGVEYTNYHCTITDDLGDSYVISYPSINMDTSDVESINNRLKSEYSKLINKINLTKAGEKFYISTVNSLDYEIYYHNNIVSILIMKNEIDEEEYTSSVNYNVYNLDKTTGTLISNDEMKDRLDITYDLSSKIRMKVIEMYALEHHYDYIGKLSYLHDEVYDDSIESVTYNNISYLYNDDEGNIKFIFKLYNPDYKRKIPYYFTIDKNEKITYEIKGK